MTPRPFYRSRLFWLGLPGLVSLSWMSLGDPGRLSMVEVRLGDHTLRFTDRLRVAQIRTEIPKNVPLGNLGIRYISPRNAKTSESPGLFPRAMQYSGWYSGRRQSSGDASIAYWFLTALYLSSWLAILAIWQRRKSRLMKLQTAP